MALSYKNRTTKDEVDQKITNAIRPYADLLTVVRKHQMQWYGHIIFSSALVKMIPQSSVQGKRSRGRPKKILEDSIIEWTGKHEDCNDSWKLVAESSLAPRGFQSAG
ncbi:hypothetical protein ElyMa_005297700 [Elysia marginata]|uniref:Uncharacterized protein n=1 Tax=Elysia marginata TaxID=1093978 RepID=A0AAV4JYB1_9GAST|nr:hypothetical protein ElyMa_005297700 [Elysia marginata]